MLLRKRRCRRVRRFSSYKGVIDNWSCSDLTRSHHVRSMHVFTCESMVIAHGQGYYSVSPRTSSLPRGGGGLPLAGIAARLGPCGGRITWSHRRWQHAAPASALNEIVRIAADTSAESNHGARACRGWPETGKGRGTRSAGRHGVGYPFFQTAGVAVLLALQTDDRPAPIGRIWYVLCVAVHMRHDVFVLFFSFP